MSDTKLKCPFCQQELRITAFHNGSEHSAYCDNCGIYGETKLWQELDRTRKALDVAVDALNKIADAPIGYNLYAEEALEQINTIKGGK